MIMKRVILRRYYSLGNWKYREDTLPDGRVLTYFSGKIATPQEEAIDRINRLAEEGMAQLVMPSFLVNFKGGKINERKQK